jgi:Spy/CpxP family protein refolding chaperone
MKTLLVEGLLIAALLGIPSSGFAQMKDMCEKDGMCKKDAEMGMDSEGMKPRMMRMGDMGGMHDMQMGMSGDMMEMMRLTHALASIDLTPDQMATMKRLRLQHQKEGIPLHAKVQLADVELNELALADTPDFKKIESVLKDKHEALVKLELSHLQLAKKMKDVLTPDQRQELEITLENGPRKPGPEKDHGHEVGPPEPHKGH